MSVKLSFLEQHEQIILGWFVFAKVVFLAERGFLKADHVFLSASIRSPSELFIPDVSLVLPTFFFCGVEHISACHRNPLFRPVLACVSVPSAFLIADF